MPVKNAKSRQKAESLITKIQKAFNGESKDIPASELSSVAPEPKIGAPIPSTRRGTGVSALNENINDYGSHAEGRTGSRVYTLADKPQGTLYGVLDHRKSKKIIKIYGGSVYTCDKAMQAYHKLTNISGVVISDYSKIIEYGDDALIFSKVGILLVCLSDDFPYVRKMNQPVSTDLIQDVNQTDSSFTVNPSTGLTAAPQTIQSGGYANVDESQEYDVYAYKTYNGNRLYSEPESVTVNPGAPVGKTWVTTGGTIGGFNITCFTESGESLFAGTEKNGVYKSTDNGVTWATVNTGLSDLRITCITSNSGYIYVGTQNGLYKSPDSVVLWTLILTRTTAVTGVWGTYGTVNITAISHINSRLMAGVSGIITDRAILVTSTDNGFTWNGSIPINGTGTTVITNGTFLVNLDGWEGSDWQYIDSTAEHVHGTANEFITTNSPLSTNTVYQLTYDIVGGNVGTLTPKNGTWTGTPRNSGNATYTEWFTANDFNIGFLPSSDFNGAITNIVVKAIPAFSITGLCFDGTNYIIGINMPTTGGVYISTDLISWIIKYTSSTSHVYQYIAQAIYFDGTYLYVGDDYYTKRALLSTTYASWDSINIIVHFMGVSIWARVHQFYYDGYNLIVASSQGILYSINNGGAWAWSDKNDSFATIKAGSNYLSGTSQGVLSSTDLSNWSTSNTGLSNSIVQCMLDTTSGLYCGTQLGVFVSQDNGGTWTSLPAITGNNNVIGLAVISTILYAATPYSVYSYNGTSWVEITDGTNLFSSATYLNGDIVTCMTYDSVASALIIGTAGHAVFIFQSGFFLNNTTGLPSSTVGVKTIYLDSSTHDIYVGLSTGGAYQYHSTSWTALGLPTGLIANSFYFAPMSVTLSGYTTLMVATNSGVYWSIDGGTTFAQANSGLTSLKINHLAVVGKNVYASADNGVYVSLVNYLVIPPVWYAVTTGLLNGSIIFLLARTSSLFASTQNGEVFFLDNADATNFFQMNVSWAVSTSNPTGYMIVFKGVSRGTQWYDITNPNDLTTGGVVTFIDDGETYVWQISDIPSVVTALWGYRYTYSLLQRKSSSIGAWDRVSIQGDYPIFESGTNGANVGKDYGEVYFPCEISSDPANTINTVAKGLQTPAGVFDVTHFGIYRTLNISEISSPPGSGAAADSLVHNPALYVWAYDLPVAKAFTATQSGNVVTATTGFFETADVGSFLMWDNHVSGNIIAITSSTTAVVDGTVSNSGQCVIGGGRVLNGYQSGKTITLTAGSFIPYNDVGKPIFWADGRISWITDVVNSTTAITDFIQIINEQAATMNMYDDDTANYNPFSRNYGDVILDDGIKVGEIGLTERNQAANTLYFPKKGFIPLPDCDIGVFDYGLVICAIRDGAKFYHSDTAVKPYCVGYYRPDLQEERVEEEIRQLCSVGSVVAVFMKTKTRTIAATSAQEAGATDIGESIYTLPSSVLVDNLIGVIAYQSIQTKGSSIIALTNDRAIRGFDGTGWAPSNLAMDRVQKDIDKIDPYQKFVSVYLMGKYGGYKIWFKEWIEN